MLKYFKMFFINIYLYFYEKKVVKEALKKDPFIYK